MFAVAVAVSTIAFWILSRYSKIAPGFINSLIGGVLITTFELLAGMIAVNYPIPLLGYGLRLIFHAFTLRAFGGLTGVLLIVATVGFIILEFMLNIGLNLVFNQYLFHY
jgi:hypothetical protein